eukprot:m.67004 g.67004  ORF g.67004 m.67004 type:complete len:99 (-) comp15960_c0_seq1:199-495(-)
MASKGELRAVMHTPAAEQVQSTNVTWSTPGGAAESGSTDVETVAMQAVVDAAFNFKDFVNEKITELIEREKQKKRCASDDISAPADRLKKSKDDAKQE